MGKPCEPYNGPLTPQFMDRITADATNDGIVERLMMLVALNRLTVRDAANGATRRPGEQP